MQQRIQRLFDDLRADEEARELLEANPLDQDIVFRIADAEDVVVTIDSDSTEVTVSATSREYELFVTTVVESDRETLEALLDGAYFSEHYLDGSLHVKGLASMKILLGQLFRINRELQADRNESAA